MIVAFVPGLVAAGAVVLAAAVLLDNRDRRRARAVRNTFAAHRVTVRRGRHFPDSRPPYDQDQDEDRGTAA